MIFTETELPGAYAIEIERREDERGFFARAWCEEEFRALGLTTRFVQCNISWTRRRGTVRGLHFQVSPHQEVKLVRCTRGVIYDVIIDLRPNSPTFKQWVSVELSAENRKMLYVPGGFAQGFQTMVDDSEVFYPASEFYHPESERGVRWDDSSFTIKWPERRELTVSEKDRSWPDFSFPVTDSVHRPISGPT